MYILRRKDKIEKTIHDIVTFGHKSTILVKNNFTGVWKYVQISLFCYYKEVLTKISCKFNLYFLISKFSRILSQSRYFRDRVEPEYKIEERGLETYYLLKSLFFQVVYSDKV